MKTALFNPFTFGKALWSLRQASDSGRPVERPAGFTLTALICGGGGGGGGSLHSNYVVIFFTTRGC